MTRSLLVVFLLFGWANTHALGDGEVKSFMEENNAYIPADSFVETGITEKQFMAVIDKIEKIYAPIVSDKGGTLSIDRDWANGTVNAYAQRKGSTWFVKMFGGMARHEFSTSDSFALVLCHELGHHLAGAPKRPGLFGLFITWATNEGQSDYWGNLKCMRHFLADEDNASVVAGLKVPKLVQEGCAQAHGADSADQYTCQRMAMAGQALGNILASMKKEALPKFETPDAGKARRTNHAHPKAQCRLDTYYQGALCSVDKFKDVDNKDPRVGTCNRSEGDKIGNRPLCWFKPRR